MALTDVQIKTAKPMAKAYKLSDAGGLYLFITIVGSKLWRLAYRYDGKQKTLSFGAYPAVTLLEARAKRDGAKALLAKEIDPAAELQLVKNEKQAHKANTFKVWGEKWLTHWQADKSERHVISTVYRLSKNIYPAIGDICP